MDNAQVYEIGRHRVAIAGREAVGPPTPYTLLLAEHIPQMSGETAVDVGTGSGFLGIVARLQGAARVYLLDTNAAAISVAMDNAKRNSVRDGFIHLPIGRTLIPLPPGELVDLVICNPAQLPLPEADRADSPFYAGRDGRRMIEALIRDTPGRLSRFGRLLMTHNSLADFPASLRLMESQGLEPQVLAERSLEFRPFINRAWLDELGGTARGLYAVRDGRAYETVYVVEARLRSEVPP
jgi:methylase of polypeptide subunit release factors